MILRRGALVLTFLLPTTAAAEGLTIEDAVRLALQNNERAQKGAASRGNRRGPARACSRRVLSDTRRGPERPPTSRILGRNPEYDNQRRPHLEPALVQPERVSSVRAAEALARVGEVGKRPGQAAARVRHRQGVHPDAHPRARAGLGEAKGRYSENQSRGGARARGRWTGEHQRRHQSGAPARNVAWARSPPLRAMS